MNDFTRQVLHAYGTLHQANQEMLDIWLHHVVFTWRWWLGVFFAVAPWAVWYVVRPRQSASRLWFVMFFIIIITSGLDFLGSGFFSFWYYTYEILPVMPSYLPWDFSMIPVLTALTIQYKPRLSPVIKAVVFAAIFAFIGEPLFAALQMYEPEHWRYSYSFVIMIVVYLFAHYLSKQNNFDSL